MTAAGTQSDGCRAAANHRSASSRGYDFVSVPELVNKTRADVMLPLSTKEWMEARADDLFLAVPLVRARHCHDFILGFFW